MMFIEKQYLKNFKNSEVKGALQLVFWGNDVDLGRK